MSIVSIRPQVTSPKDRKSDTNLYSAECFSQDIGWRGYRKPALQDCSRRPISRILLSRFTPYASDRFAKTAYETWACWWSSVPEAALFAVQLDCCMSRGFTLEPGREKDASPCTFNAWSLCSTTNGIFLRLSTCLTGLLMSERGPLWLGQGPIMPRNADQGLPIPITGRTCWLVAHPDGDYFLVWNLLLEHHGVLRSRTHFCRESSYGLVSSHISLSSSSQFKQTSMLQTWHNPNSFSWIQNHHIRTAGWSTDLWEALLWWLGSYLTGQFYRLHFALSSIKQLCSSCRRQSEAQNNYILENAQFSPDLVWYSCLSSTLFHSSETLWGSL